MQKVHYTAFTEWVAKKLSYIFARANELILNLNFNNLEYAFEKSEDGLTFNEVLMNNVAKSYFSWKEIQKANISIE